MTEIIRNPPTSGTTEQSSTELATETPLPNDMGSFFSKVPAGRALFGDRNEDGLKPVQGENVKRKPSTSENKAPHAGKSDSILDYFFV